MAPNQMNPLEEAVMCRLLEGNHPVLHELQRQLENAHIRQRTETGVGFHLYFDVPQSLSQMAETTSFSLCSVIAEIEGLLHGAGFVLHVRKGTLSSLEGYSYDEPWPSVIHSFRLSYRNLDERNLTGVPACIVPKNEPHKRM